MEQARTPSAGPRTRHYLDVNPAINEFDLSLDSEVSFGEFAPPQRRTAKKQISYQASNFGIQVKPGFRSQLRRICPSTAQDRERTGLVSGHGFSRAGTA
jgi:hypothetical protein